MTTKAELRSRLPRFRVRLYVVGFVMGATLLTAGFGLSFWRWQPAILGELVGPDMADVAGHGAGAVFMAAGLFTSYRFLCAIVRTYVEALSWPPLRSLEG